MDSTINSTTACFISTTLEPIPFPSIQRFIFLLYLFTSLLATLGNFIVIIVQLYGRESSRSIRKYLVNLSAADITLSLMSMPFTYTNIVLGHWDYPAWLCPTAQYAQLLSAFITATTLSLIGIERYIVTLHPLSPLSRWIKAHNTSLLLLFWLLGTAYAYPPIAHTAVSKFLLNDTVYHQCHYLNELSSFKLRLFTCLNFLLTFLLPLVIITFSYSAIISKLNAGNDPLILCYCAPKAEHSLHAENRSKALKIMFAVILAYCICWFPVKIFQFLINYNIITYCTEGEFYLMVGSYLAFHWLAMANSLINPIIYSYMSKSFRNDFWKITKYIFTHLHC